MISSLFTPPRREGPHSDWQNAGMIESVRSHRNRVLATLLLGTALAMAACERPEREVGAQAGAVQTLAWTPAQEVPALQPERLVARHEPPDDVDQSGGWRVRAGKSRIADHPSSGLDRGLFLLGSGEKEIVIPGPFDPQEFNQIVLTLIVKLRSSVRIELRRAGDAHPKVASVPLLSRARPQRVVAGFARNALESEPFDSLAVVFPASAGPIYLVAVDRIDMPLDSWLGAADSIRPVELSGETRPASLLRRGIDLQAPLVVEEGARLDFSFALEPDLRFPAQVPRLHVRVAGESGHTLEREIEIGSKARGSVSWNSLTLDLEGFEKNEEARLSVALEARGHQPAFAWVGEPRLARPRADARTVLFITSDTHRGDHLGAAGAGVKVLTPTLDALAERGVLFERAFSSTEITVPSHVALMTGVHPRDTRVLANFSGISERARTLASAFRSAGWRTFASVSARQLGHPISGLGTGFERLAAPAGESPGQVAVDRLLRWMDDAQGQPLFAWLHLFDAHAPYEAPEEVLAGYRADLDRTASTSDAESERERRRIEYRAEVSWVDRQLGRVLAVPRLQRAWIGLTADHGECLGANGIYFTHVELFRDTLHVPLLLAGPEIPRGVRVTGRVSHLSLGRTLLDLAGLPDRPFPGKNLLEGLASTASDPTPPLFALAYAARSASVTEADLHLVLYLHDHDIGTPQAQRSVVRHQCELYDLARDPGCEHNLSRERPEDTRRLRRVLIEWLAASRATGWQRDAAIGESEAELLAAMGYSDPGESDEQAPWGELDCDCPACRMYR